MPWLFLVYNAGDLDSRWRISLPGVGAAQDGQL
jgi:hypothetical protein